MKKATADITAFHRAGNAPVLDHPQIPPSDRVELRKRLIREEVGETLTAIDEEDLVELADGIADSIVVLIGTALEYGIPLEEVWEEVHRANMDKFPPCSNTHCHSGRVYIYDDSPSSTDPCPDCNGRGTQLLLRDDGKILKPEGWEPPDIAKVLSAVASASAPAPSDEPEGDAAPGATSSGASS